MTRMKFLGLVFATLLNVCIADKASAFQDVLVDSLDGPQFAPTGGLYYKKNFEQSAGTVEFQKDVKLSGEGALKLSVKPLCAASQEECSERAEIWERTKLRVPCDKGVWCGFAVKFTDPVPQDDHRYLIAQWKREIDPGAAGDFSPFFALRLNNGKLFATVESNYQASQTATAMGQCPKGSTPVWLRPETDQMRALVATPADWTGADSDLFKSCTDKIHIFDHGNKLPEPASGWIDFAVYTEPGADGTGHIELFANGKWISTVKGNIGHAGPGLGKNQYFKFGPYRAANTGTWSLYYDDFRRSSRCADVLKGGTCPF